MFIVFCAWIIGLGYESARECRSVCLVSGRGDPGTLRTNTFDAVAVLAGTLFTYPASVELGMGPVVASGLAGIVAVVVAKPYAVAAFCGSFVGMASPQAFGYPEVTAAGFLAAAIFVASKPVFGGFGGKLGTIAWSSSVSVALVLDASLTSEAVYPVSVGAPLVFYATVGAVVTFVLSIRFAWGAVLASGAVGVAAGIVLPLVHGSDPGSLYAVSAFCGSFAGMCSLDRFTRTSAMIPAGILCGLILIYSAPFFGGGGGKLGTAAFGAVIGLRGLLELGRPAYSKGESGPRPTAPMPRHTPLSSNHRRT